MKLGRWKQVHHLTYERLGEELDSDLQALCKPCHNLAEAEKGNPYWLVMSIFRDFAIMPKPLYVKDKAPSDVRFLGPEESYSLSGPSLGSWEGDLHGRNAERVKFGRR